MANLLLKSVLDVVCQRIVGSAHNHEMTQILLVDSSAIVFIHLTARDHHLVIQDSELSPMPGNDGCQCRDFVQEKPESILNVPALCRGDNKPKNWNRKRI